MVDRVEYLTVEYLVWAITLGGISALSLPLGSWVGLQANPRPQIVSILAAFGAGALIAALTVELVAPTLFLLESTEIESHHGDPVSAFFALVSGMAIGGILFTLLDRLVNARGGFLRHTASTVSYLMASKRKRELALLENFAMFPPLTVLGPDHINTLMAMIKPVSYSPGEILGKEGELAQILGFIVEGSIVARSSDGLEHRFEKGSVLGVYSLMTNRPNLATAKAERAVKGYSISRPDFLRLCELSPDFKKSIQQIAEERVELTRNLFAQREAQTQAWLEASREALRTDAQVPEDPAWRKVGAEHNGVPLAIWLGILIDGVPESFVIGARLLIELENHHSELGSIGFADVVPYTLIAGLFLSNFPEAMASSANMQTQGFSKHKVFMLWFSLLVITAAGAGAGFLLADALSPTSLVFAEGLAAGAMLTMIAAAMIPEAVHMGKSSTVGISTLAGFLAAISFKLLG